MRICALFTHKRKLFAQNNTHFSSPLNLPSHSVSLQVEGATIDEADLYGFHCILARSGRHTFLRIIGSIPFSTTQARFLFGELGLCRTALKLDCSVAEVLQEMLEEHQAALDEQQPPSYTPLEACLGPMVSPNPSTQEQSPKLWTRRRKNSCIVCRKRVSAYASSTLRWCPRQC